MNGPDLIVAPHPDDETLGCGGTALRSIAEGREVHWVIVTRGGAHLEQTEDVLEAREKEIRAVGEAYGFAEIHRLNAPAARLDDGSIADLVAGLAAIVRSVRPETLYLPFPGDAHSDHAVAFDAAAPSTKWFRQPSVRRVLAYETPSETEFGLNANRLAFRPNVFVDIGAYLTRKVEIMQLFRSEVGEFPFPRSERAIRALAEYRGATAGFEAAEAFLLLKERCP